MITTYQSLALASRPSFKGLIDKYRPTNPYFTKSSNESLALRGVSPYDIKGDIFSQQYQALATNRLASYRLGWKFYKGEHWINAFEDGELKPVFNYCGIIADRGASWLAGSGFRVKTLRGNELVADALTRIWDSSDGALLLEKAAQFGAVTGDSFFYVTVKSKDSTGSPLPKKQWRMHISVLNPEHVFPFWSEENPGELASCLIQFPVMLGGADAILYTCYITPQFFETWMGTQHTKTRNPFGKVNVVHVPNMLSADSCFGSSDIERVIPINEEYNSIAWSTRKTIHYHAEPTTLIYGIRASQLERGANKVWSNLPVTAKVENLELKGDLSLNREYLRLLEDNICVVSSTPRIALESKELAISGTSGLALQMQFQPLIEKTKGKYKTYGKGIRQVNELLILGHQKIIGQPLTELADDPANITETRAQFISPLPKDEQTDLDLATKRVEAGVWSIAEAIRRVGDITDTERLALELAADKRSELAFGYEKQRALMGCMPEASVAFLSSVFLSEDLQSMTKASND